MSDITYIVANVSNYDFSIGGLTPVKLATLDKNIITEIENKNRELINKYKAKNSDLFIIFNDNSVVLLLPIDIIPNKTSKVTGVITAKKFIIEKFYPQTKTWESRILEK
ncbi:hypothetical protein MrNuV_ORF014 [Macrobrachium rosenbergii nudivirus]|nr:hypothetical protein MrNuV_ORF014 [Macrobrachium rosenbergii nudivirus]